MKTRMNKEIATNPLALRKELPRRFGEFRVIFKQNVVNVVLFICVLKFIFSFFFSIILHVAFNFFEVFY